MVDCYVGMGGNFSETLAAMRCCVAELKKEFTQFKLSRLYRTTPVSQMPQAPYLNAVCRFQTELAVELLWQKLQILEKSMGKERKPKDAPRLIDLDLLFYGSLVTATREWVIPHPRWHERLFVLAPLADVTEELPLEGGGRLCELLSRFSNPHQESVALQNEWISYA
jgi:2-amino-4-hydroxy-6-hydroxymethyldihydropteridine diphosphokinase